MIKAIFFDVDGTLVSHTKNEVSASTRRSLKKLRERHIQCVLATGRHMLELDMLPVRDICFDGYVMLNGQMCLNEKKEIIYGNPINGEAKESLLALFHGKEIPVMLVEQERMYNNFIDNRVEEAQKAISSELPEIGNYTGAPIYQAIAFVNEKEEAGLKDLLPDCKITRWNPYGVDIISDGGGKTNGIRQYLLKYQIPQEETMAFGDGENDMEMLQFAGIGVAMGNADECVKACADYVTSHIDEDGIERALKHFQLI